MLFSQIRTAEKYLDLGLLKTEEQLSEFAFLGAWLLVSFIKFLVWNPLFESFLNTCILTFDEQSEGDKQGKLLL